MATEFDNYHGEGGAFEAIASGQLSTGDTVTIQGEQRVVGTSGQLIPADNPQTQALVQAKNEAVAQATKTNPVTNQEVQTAVQGAAGQAVGTDSVAADAAIQPDNTVNVFTQETINVVPDDTAYLNRDISQDFTEAGTLAVGAEVKVEEKNGKFYLKDAKGDYLSNSTVLGSKGKKNSKSYVFKDLDSANYYINFRGFKTPEQKRLDLLTTIDIETPVDETPVAETPIDQTPVVDPIIVDPTPPFDPNVAGGDFTSVTPDTTVQDLGVGEVPVIDPNKPQTVVQDVAPVTYQDVMPPTTTNTTPVGEVNPSTGTFSTPLQTAGLSAVPSQVSYKTHYAGTAGAVPQTLVTTAPGMGQQYTTGYQNVPYANNLGQRIMVTEFNGKPTTYVPPGFFRVQQQAQTNAVAASEGGLMDTMTLEGKDRIFRKMGYNGPKTRKGHEQFEAASPAAKAKGMAVGGYVQKFSNGGFALPNSVMLREEAAKNALNQYGTTTSTLGTAPLGTNNQPTGNFYSATQDDVFRQDDILTSPGPILPFGTTTPSAGDPVKATVGQLPHAGVMKPLAGVDQPQPAATPVAATQVDPTLEAFFPDGMFNDPKFLQAMASQQTGPKVIPPAPEPTFKTPEEKKSFEAIADYFVDNRYDRSKGSILPPNSLSTQDVRPDGLSSTEYGFLLQHGKPYSEMTEEEKAAVDNPQPSANTSPFDSNTAQTNFGQQPASTLTPEQIAAMQASAVSQTMQPIQATTAMIQPTAGEFIPVDAGQTTPIAPFAEAATAGTVEQAQMPTATDAATMTPTTVSSQVQQETDKLEAAKGTVSEDAIVDPAQQETSSVSGLEGAQGEAIKVNAPDAREIQDGEIIDGVADATKAAAFTEQIQHAEATPSKQATVKGQLESLMADFEGGETPAWAAGSMRTAMATLAARGLGASSLAGQAVIQAAMESALPIAMQDASTMAQFEAQNLSNRQQRQMLAAQQRATFLGMEFDQAFQAKVMNAAKISDIANMNFTAEQQIALEDARAANTMELSNLSNRQAMVLAEAAALSQLDLANLNNRQQAAVQNANSFLQMDMANLSNEQQTSMFKSQQNIQALFSDQAAANAAAQFNATSENQTNQFFANLANQTSQFNASQRNAMDQFNINSVNALREFNSGLQQQRDLFNAQNGLVIAQSNAAWRQTIATINTATQNQSNMDFAKVINGLTAANMDQIWQRERDLMSFAFQLENNNADRATTIAVQELANEASSSSDAASRSASFSNAIGSIVGAIITG